MGNRVVGTVEEQLQLEQLKTEEGVNKAVQELNKAIKRGEFGDTVYGRILLKLGYQQYVDKLTEYFEATLYTNHKKARDLIQLFTEDIQSIAYIAMVESINGAISRRPLTGTSLRIMRKLKDIYMMERLRRDNPKLHTYLGQRFRRASKKDKRLLISKHIETLYNFNTVVEGEYSLKQLTVRAGSTLINILELSGTNIIEVLDVRNMGDKSGSTKCVCLTKEANDILTDIDCSTSFLATINKLPMIVPPKDWTNLYNGGWFKGDNFLFSVKSDDVQKHLKEHTYEKLLPIVNKLQQTAWRVNTKVYEVLKHVFDGNMIDPKSPSMAPYLYGEIATSETYTWKDFIKREDYEDWKDFNRVKEDLNIRLNATFSNRIEIMYSLSVANTMMKYAKLYYPYSLDYRGRVYSDVNFLTPQGQHYTKAMLEFGDGVYLDDNGIFWLKVHIANVYGKDKEEYEDRIQWFEDNEVDILTVARDPIDNLRMWVWSDSPYEFLAGCFAWLDYIEGRPNRLPIQLDATCSGIQMYSGLVRDEPGGLAVNVIGNKRNDIYQIVANKVNAYLSTRQYNHWVEYVDREGVEHKAYTVGVADSMVGKITRKIVKPNVMTVPYSVTRRGMSNQIWDIIDDATLKNKEFWVGDRWIANKVITQLNHTAIYDTIDGAKKGQEYLVDLSRNLNGPATWKGVLYDFPIRQTSLELKETRVSTLYGTLKLNIEVPKLNKRRQSNSIAPNFIHNIDSTILMYVIDNMEEQIGVIHDCFLVQPNDGYKVQEAYKEGFIAVMEADPLRNIQKQLDPDGLVEFPEYGTLDLNEVRNSKYIIS